MESNVERILRDRLEKIYDEGDESLRKLMLTLLLTELSEKSLRSYLLLFGGGKE